LIAERRNVSTFSVALRWLLKEVSIRMGVINLRLRLRSGYSLRGLWKMAARFRLVNVTSSWSVDFILRHALGIPGAPDKTHWSLVAVPYRVLVHRLRSLGSGRRVRQRLRRGCGARGSTSTNTNTQWLALFVAQILHQAVMVGVQIEVIVGGWVVVDVRRKRFFLDLHRDWRGLRSWHRPLAVGAGRPRPWAVARHRRNGKAVG